MAQAEAKRQLVVVVEGTAALGPYWSTILTDYVEKIARRFCASEVPGKKLAGDPPELALVVFHTHGPYNAFCVQRSGWTKDIDAFVSWLSGIYHSAVEDLVKFLFVKILQGSSNTTQNNQNHEAKKHCILVAASNPYPSRTPAYYLPIQCNDQKENTKSSKGHSVADAETVAKSFAQCFVSLSVISPKQFPALKAKYNAGKRNPQDANPPVDHAKNLDFLVLLSEDFMVARTALSRPLYWNMAPKQTIMKMESAPAVTMPGPTSNADPSVNGPMVSLQPADVGGISTSTFRVEPATIPQMVCAPAFSHITPISNVASQGGHTAMGLANIGATPLQVHVSNTGVHSVGATNISAKRHPNAQQPPPKCVKIWEGSLYGLKNGHPVWICKLEGYGIGTAAETLAIDWPETMVIVHLINQEHMNKCGKAEFLAFQALNQHRFLGQLKEGKLCAVIQLPSQTLLLSMPDREDRLLGLLLPGDTLVIKPPVSDHQPTMQQQHTSHGNNSCSSSGGSCRSSRNSCSNSFQFPP